MTYRALANASPVPVRPPQILGFALYLIGTGCLALGVSQLARFAENLHAIPFSPLSVWSFVIGEAMVLLGLAIAWRATKGHQRRLLGVAATLWLTLFVVEMQRERYVLYLLAHAPGALGGSLAASIVGRAIVLLVVALVVHASGRAFASRTWATTLGALLVVADAWAGAWPVLTHVRLENLAAGLFQTTPSMAFGGIGLLLIAGGLFTAGRDVLGAVTIDPTPALRAGLPLFADAAVAIAGLAVTHAVALAVSSKLGGSMHDSDDTSTLGGEIVAWTLMMVAIHRMKPLTARAEALALATACAFVAVTALRYVLWSNGVLGADAHGSLPTTIRPAAEVARWVLVIVTLSAVAKARARHVRSSLFVGMLAASAASSMVASYGSADGAGLVVIGLAALLGAVALHAAIGMAAEVRRIEISR